VCVCVPVSRLEVHIYKPIYTYYLFTYILDGSAILVYELSNLWEILAYKYSKQKTYGIIPNYTKIQAFQILWEIQVSKHN